MECSRGTCPIRGPTEVQRNACNVRRKERVLACKHDAGCKKEKSRKEKNTQGKKFQESSYTTR
ncbi:MAG: hypothetical protein QW594_04540 [Candidatus Woesearchaeota archaeon]